MKRAAGSILIAFALMLGAMASAHAQQQDPYMEGPVVNATYVRTLPGQFDNYMRYIFGDYARLMNAYKEAGIILEWGVLTTQTRSPDEANVILTTTYANMAAFDNLDERSRPIVQQVMGANPQQAEQAFAQRGAMRVSLGGQLYRVLQPRQ